MARKFFNSLEQQAKEKKRSLSRSKAYIERERKHILKVTKDARIEMAAAIAANPLKDVETRKVHQCDLMPKDAPNKIVQYGNRCPYCKKLLLDVVVEKKDERLARERQKDREITPEIFWDNLMGHKLD